MRGFKRFEISEPPYSSLFYTEATAAWWPTRTASLFADDEAEVEHLGFSLDILNPSPSPFDLHLPFLRPRHALPSLGLIESAAAVDLIYSSSAALRRYQERAETDLFLQGINDRVIALELGFDRTLRSEIDSSWDRKYKWTAEIQGAKEDRFDKKYKWMTEVKGGDERNFKWTAEIKGKGKDAPASRKYTFHALTAPGKGAGEEKKKEKEKEKEKEKKGSRSTAHVVEIEEQPNPGAIVIRKAFNRRVVKLSKGKRKELSPQDAALIIQMSFRAYLVRRSQVLRGLRDLAVAKAKLKEIRALFSSFSYRRRIVIDAEEHQRFSEKIIVLLLTVDAIEGPDYMVRAAKKSMVEELEAMLEVVDPQPPGKLGSMKRRRFDLPDGGPISKELSTGVAEVVQMLDREDV